MTGDCGETVVVVLPHACFRAFLVLPCARILLVGRKVFKRRMMNAQTLVKSGKVQSYRSTGVWLVEL